MESICNCLRIDAKELKKYEKFPVESLQTHKINNTEEEMCSFTAQTSRSSFLQNSFNSTVENNKVS